MLFDALPTTVPTTPPIVDPVFVAPLLQRREGRVAQPHTSSVGRLSRDLRYLIAHLWLWMSHRDRSKQTNIECEQLQWLLPTTHCATPCCCCQEPPEVVWPGGTDWQKKLQFTVRGFEFCSDSNLPTNDKFAILITRVKKTYTYVINQPRFLSSTKSRISRPSTQPWTP